MNFALFWDTQNPVFEVKYKNEQGDLKFIKYAAKIESIGYKWEWAYKINFIFFVGSDLNFYNTNKNLDISWGIDLATNLIDFTYVDFGNAPGGMIILGIPLPWVAKGISQAAKIIQDPSSFNKIIIPEVNEAVGFTGRYDIVEINPVMALLNLVNPSIVTGGYLTALETK